MRIWIDATSPASQGRIFGMSHAEIAEELGREIGAVRVLLHRALVRLGRLMHEDSATS